LVRVCIAEKNATSGGMEMTNHGLAYQAGTMCQHNDFAMK
jgi:hypothetical protein